MTDPLGMRDVRLVVIGDAFAAGVGDPKALGWVGRVVARSQTPEVVINSIVNPSSDIAQGYNGDQLTLADGTVIHGLVVSSGDPVVVQSTGGVTQMVPAARIQPG